MVIDPNSINSATGSARNRSSAPVANPSPKPVTQAPQVEPQVAENVVISQGAKSLHRLQSAIQQAPDVNVSRVAELKKAIAEGRFEINPDRIAENMLKQDELFN